MAQKAVRHSVIEKEKERQEIKEKADQRRQEREEEKQQKINEQIEIEENPPNTSHEIETEADIEIIHESINKSPVPSLPPIEDSSRIRSSVEKGQTIFPILTTQTSEEIKKITH